MMTARDGWRRFPLHLGTWFGVPSTVFYLLSDAGIGYGAWLWWSCAAAAVWVGYREPRSTWRGNQTLGKQIIDSAAKLGGLALAIWTAAWWWR